MTKEDFNGLIEEYANQNTGLIIGLAVGVFILVVVVVFILCKVYRKKREASKKEIETPKTEEIAKTKDYKIAHCESESQREKVQNSQ